MSLALARPAPEIAKVAAFLRRDVLMALSYRTQFASDALMLFGQAVISAFVARIVDPSVLPSFGGRTAGYLTFVTVGIALTSFLQVGLTRLTGVIGSERFLGTLEAVLLSRARITTLQVGWVAYDMLYVPLRSFIFFSIMVVAFGVDIQASGAIPALAFLIVFLPFVWGAGVTSAAATLVFRRAGFVNGILGFTLTFSSGALFPLDVLPAPVAAVAHYSPVAIAVRGSREALIGGVGWAELAPDLALLAVCAAVSLWVGTRIFDYAFRRELRSGAIGLY
jgi:ABC-2 type transport system permease protein